MKRQTGFTLIEVMIVVVIIAILAGIAMPAYNDYVTRSKITDATSNLAQKRVQMEQFFQDNHTYVGAPPCNADTTASKYFDFSCSAAATAAAYTLQAVGKDSMVGFAYTIDQGNTKTTTIAAPASSGWIATSTSCWIANKGGAC